MSNRKVMQAPRRSRDNRVTEARVKGFWDWLLGGYYGG